VKETCNQFENRALKAETLVSISNLKDDFVVQMDGVFYRNYTEDLISTEQDLERNTVTLSRDSIYHILPEKLFFDDISTKGIGKRNFTFAENYEEVLRKRKEILSFFQPFDTSFFKLSLELEHKLNALSETGNSYFNVFFLNEIKPNSRTPKADADKYIPKLKLLLPFVSQIRGNFPLLIDLLRNIFEANQIEVKEIEPLKRRFIIHKEGLNKEEYLAMDKELVPFFDFLQHWFLPLEMKYDYRIKDYKQPFILGESLILEYNTNL
jgi:hypothetical protein